MRMAPAYGCPPSPVQRRFWWLNVVLRWRRAPVAQWTERRTSNPRVAGSNPARRTSLSMRKAPLYRPKGECRMRLLVGAADRQRYGRGPLARRAGRPGRARRRRPRGRPSRGRGEGKASRLEGWRGFARPYPFRLARAGFGGLGPPQMARCRGRRNLGGRDPLRRRAAAASGCSPPPSCPPRTRAHRRGVLDLSPPPQNSAVPRAGDAA